MSKPSVNLMGFLCSPPAPLGLQRKLCRSGGAVISETAKQRSVSRTLGRRGAGSSSSRSWGGVGERGGKGRGGWGKAWSSRCARPRAQSPPPPPQHPLWSMHRKVNHGLSPVRCQQLFLSLVNSLFLSPTTPHNPTPPQAPLSGASWEGGGWQERGGHAGGGLGWDDSAREGRA